MKVRSVSHKLRYVLSALIMFSGVMWLLYGMYATAIACFITGLLCMPVWYDLIRNCPADYAFFVPLISAALTLVIFFASGPITEDVHLPLKTTYISPTERTDISSKQTDVTVYTGNTVVYRTPGGKRYHLNADCAGENAFSVSCAQAISDGLTPCKKCAQ